MIKRILSALLILPVLILSAFSPVKNIENLSVSSTAPKSTAVANKIEYSSSNNTQSINGSNISNTVTMTTPEDLIEIDIDNTIPKSKNFIGIGGVYHGSSFLPDTVLADPYTDEQIALEVENVKKSGASIVRTMFVEDLVWDEANYSFNWETEGMQGYYKFFEAMQNIGVTVAVNFGWTLSQLNGSGASPRPTVPMFKLMAQKDGIANPTNEDCIPYHARLYAEFVEEVIVKRGYTNVSYAFMFTESNNAGYGDYESQSKELFNVWHKAVRAVHNALVADGNRNLIKFIGPNSTFSCEMDWVKWAVEDANDIIDIYSCHKYTYTDSWYDGASPYTQQYDWCTQAAEVVAKTGKPFITDETNAFINNRNDNKEELRIAQYADKNYGDFSDDNPLGAVSEALNYIANMNAGSSGVIRWSLVSEKFINRSVTNSDSFFEGVQVHGLLPYLKVSGTPLYDFYVYEMIASSVNGHPNTNIYAVDPTQDIYCTMTESSDGAKSIIVVSNALSENTVSFNLAKSLGGEKVYKYVYDPDTIKATNNIQPLEPVGYYENITDNITDILKPNTIIVYTTVKH